jgi:hypothetical protein
MGHRNYSVRATDILTINGEERTIATFARRAGLYLPNAMTRLTMGESPEAVFAVKAPVYINTDAAKREIALRLGITPAEWDASQKRIADRKAELAAMTPHERKKARAADAKAEKLRIERVVAERKARYAKRDGITIAATVIEESK